MSTAFYKVNNVSTSGVVIYFYLFLISISLFLIVFLYLFSYVNYCFFNDKIDQHLLEYVDILLMYFTFLSYD